MNAGLLSLVFWIFPTYAGKEPISLGEFEKLEWEDHHAEGTMIRGRVVMPVDLAKRWLAKPSPVGSGYRSTEAIVVDKFWMNCGGWLFIPDSSK